MVHFIFGLQLGHDKPNVFQHKASKNQCPLVSILHYLGFFERSLEHTTFKGGESSEISGLGSALVLSLS